MPQVFIPHIHAFDGAAYVRIVSEPAAVLVAGPGKDPVDGIGGRPGDRLRSFIPSWLMFCSILCSMNVEMPLPWNRGIVAKSVSSTFCEAWSISAEQAPTIRPFQRMQ